MSCIQQAAAAQDTPHRAKPLATAHRGAALLQHPQSSPPIQPSSMLLTISKDLQSVCRCSCSKVLQCGCKFHSHQVHPRTDTRLVMHTAALRAWLSEETSKQTISHTPACSSYTTTTQNPVPASKDRHRAGRTQLALCRTIHRRHKPYHRYQPSLS
jgi:hypothetical protein